MAAYFWSLILLPVYFGCVLTLNQQEINALEELQTKWNIPNWRGEPNCTTWFRHLTCNGHLNVISLDIGFAKPELLSGSIPAEICNLTYLEELKLYGNRLSGEIPNCIGGLVHLSYLDLSGNCLGGEIPESLGNLTRLEYFDLSVNHHNELSFSHCGLCRKSILANGLTGAIPASVGRMTKVKFFYLSGNRLTGEIPESLGNLTNAMYIYINANNLTGSLPKTIGNLQNLRDLQLNNNNLTGAIPKEIGNCVSIRIIQMSRNHITGKIPTTIGNLAQLQALELLENNLEGRIPEFKTTPVLNLNLFDVRHNNLSGALPESFGDAPLRYLLLSNNPLLRGHGNKLPDYITPNFATKSIVDDERQFDCPGFALHSRVFQVTAPLIQLDPPYYNYSLCDCKSGYFGSPPDKCRQCLLHGSCYGNSAMEFDGYPVINDTGDLQGFIECTDVLACNPGGHCFYGKNGLRSDNYGNCSLCAPNYYGRLCSKCACSLQACFYHGHNECKPCKKIKANTVVLYSIALIVTLSLFAVFHNSSLVRLLFIIVLVSLVLTSESGSWLYLNILVVMIILIPATSNGLSSGLVKSLIFYLQTTPVLIPPVLNRTLSSELSRFSFFVFRFSDVKIIGLVCLFPNILGFSANATLHRYIFSLCAPIIVFLLVLVFLVFKNVLLFALRKAGFRSPSSGTTRAQILFSLVFIAYFSFFNASALVISVFICSKDASGHSYMTAQHYRSVQCHSSEWHNMVIAAIIGAIFLVFLPLIIFTAVLYKHKSTQDDPELMSWLGYLYVSYRPRDSTKASKLRNRSWFYFEIVYMIFRFLLAVSLSVPRQGEESLWAPSLTAILLLALATILLTLKPYARKVDNKAAFISIITLIIELFTSVPFDNPDGAQISNDFTWVRLMSIYIALNVLTIFMFFVLILWYGRDELKRNVHNVKVSLLYLCNRLRECRRPNTEDQEPCHENFEQ